MRRFIRGFAVPFVVLALPLGVLAGLGFVAAHRQLARTHEAAVASTVDAVTGLVADYQHSLQRETVLLARDPAVVEGTVKGDWAVLARGASPRVLAITRDGLADFITIRDSRGAPLVQVPASPPPSLPETPTGSEAVLTLRLADGQPYFLVTAPVQGPAGREARGPAGTVVAGRRVEGLGPALERLRGRPAVVFVSGDRALAASRTDLPTSGFARAATLGATEVGAELFALRRLGGPVATSPDGGLWVMLAVAEFARAERRLLIEFLGLLGAGAVVLAAVVLAFLPPAARPRPTGGPGPRPDTPRAALERRNRELEALNAVFATMSRGGDLATTAAEALEVIRGLARMDVGAIYRLDRDGGQLVLEGQSGFDPRHLDRARTRPLDGSHVGIAARTGQLLLTHLDASPPSDEGIREMAAERAHRTQLAVPIPVENRTWGVMALVSREQREFTPEEMTTLSGVAQHVGLAVERAQLRDMAAARLSRLEAQRVIERHISEQLDTEELLVVIARSAQRLIGGTFAALYLLEGDTLRPRAWSDVPEGIRDLRFTLGAGAAGAAIAAGRGMLVNDYPSSPHAMAEFVPFTSRLLAAPLMAGGRALGVMTAGRGPGAPVFTDEDLSTLTDFATQTAVALEHARLFDEATRNAARYQALLEVSGAVGSTLEVDRVLDLVVDRCRTLLGVAAVGVMRVDRDSGVVAYERGRGLSGEFTAALRVRLGEGTTGRAIEERVPVWSEDVLNDPALALSPEARALIEREGYRAVLSVPLLTKGDAHGAIAAYWWEPHRPSAGEIAIMTAFAGQAATALDNARLFAQERDRKASLSSLLEVNKKIGALVSPETLLTSIAEEGARLLEVDNAGFRLLDGDDLVVAGLAGTAAQTMARARIKVGESLSGKVVASGQALMCELEAGGVLAEHLAADRRLGYTHYLGVPLLVGERAIGVLTFRARRPFTAREQELAETFAGQAAIAIDHSRLYREASEQADRMRVVAELGRALVSTLDEARVLEMVASQAHESLGMLDIAIWLQGDDGGPLRLAAGQGPFSSRLAARAEPLNASEGVVGRALTERAPVWTPDVLNDPRIPLRPQSRRWIEETGGRSILAVPLIREHLMGALVVYRPLGERYSGREVEYLSAFGNLVAVALENARLYTQVQGRLRETTALLSVGRALSQPESTTHLMRTVAREVAHAFGADMVGVYSLDAKREALVPTAGYHVPKHLLERFLTQPFLLERFPALAQVWREGRAAWSADAQADPRFDRGLLAGVDAHSVLFAPTTVRGEPVGALFLVWWQTGREFPESEVRLLEGVAGQVGLGMENAELARQTELKLQETETLLSVSQTLASTLDVDAMTRQLLRHVALGLGADCAAIWLLQDDGEWMTPLAGHHVPPEQLEALRHVRLSLRHHAFYRDAAEQRRSVISTGGDDDLRIPEEVRRAAPARTRLFVPIFAQEQMIGGFSADWWDKARELSEAERRLMEAVASQAGVALQHARLFQDNQRRVRELSVLHELSRSVTGQLDQAGILDTVYQQVARILDVRNFSAFLMDEEHARLAVVLRVRQGRRCEEEEPRFYPRAPAGLSWVVCDTGRPIRTTDYVAECARHGVRPLPGFADVPHSLIVPMSAGDRVLGVLALGSPDRAFTDADERLLVNLAQLVALMLRSARLYEERTRALGELGAAQDQLVRTEKLSALGEMASGVAHDFNNLLASILGRAQLLLERVQDEKLRQWLQVIERAALDGARTVRRLQDFTGIRRDQPAVAVDLNQIVTQVLETTESIWRQDSRRRGVEIAVETDLAERLPPVAGDPAELREAFTNLVLNAVDAMPQGGTLILRTGTVEGQAQVEVCDTGTGIPEHILEKIFDPFFTTKGPKGTGLGLSMAYGILQRHNGRITVESEEGRGTVFRLRFPVAVSSPAADAVPAPATPAGPPVSRHCLVVDDEQEVAEVVADILSTAGHTAVTARGGQQAVDRLGAERFDVVFTDLAMPGMTGWQVARAVKDRAPEVPVVLMSGFGVEVVPEDLHRHGVDLVLAKPLRIEDVLRALASLRAGAGRP